MQRGRKDCRTNLIEEVFRVLDEGRMPLGLTASVDSTSLRQWAILENVSHILSEKHKDLHNYLAQAGFQRSTST